jgi:hypothetical protein
MNESDKITLDKDEKWLTMFALDGVRLAHIALSETRNPIKKWRDKRRASHTVKQIFQEVEPDEPYTLKDSEVGLVKNSLESAIKARMENAAAKGREVSDTDLKLEKLLVKVGPHESKLHSRIK